MYDLYSYLIINYKTYLSCIQQIFYHSRIENKNDLFLYASLSASTDDVSALASRSFRVRVRTSDSGGLELFDDVTVRFVVSCGSDVCGENAFCDTSDVTRPTCVCRNGFYGKKA